MRFAKIGVNTKQVALVRQDKDSKTGALEEISLTSPERPMTSFSDAVQAFKGYVLGLLPFKVPADRIVITTLSLSESKDGRRGLQVSCNVPIPKCDDKVISLTTPLVHEPGEDATGDSFALSDAVMALVATAEQEATKYADGDRMQMTLALEEKSSENAKEFNVRSAAAESATTRKPKGKSGGKKTVRARSAEKLDEVIDGAMQKAGAVKTGEREWTLPEPPPKAETLSPVAIQ